MAGIITLSVEQFNGQVINDLKGINVDEIVRARTLKDGKVFLQVANDGSLNMNEYILDASETLSGLKTKIDAAGTDNDIQLPVIPIYREETGGGSQDFTPATNFILNKGFFLDVTNTKSGGVVTGTVIQYRNNYNDYFAVLYTSEDLLTVSGNGEAVGV